MLWVGRPAAAAGPGDGHRGNLLLHAFPDRVRPAAFAWRYSAWLGTVSAALFAMTVLSGLPLLMLYVPSVEGAYRSMKDIEHVVAYGWWIRAAHRLAAHLMIGAALLHLARVFVTGAYKGTPGEGRHRGWNWLIGVALLFATLALSFTGYLLPWDQLAFWAVTVGANLLAAVPLAGDAVRELLLGGRDVGQATLVRFYALHVFALPGAVLVLLAYHLWRIRKDGGLATPAAIDGTAFGVPDLVRRTAVVSLGTLALVSALALVIASPLEEPANALVTPNPAKAPWYFVWLQELVADTTLRIGSVTLSGALLGGAVLPAILFVAGAAWPWLDSSPAEAAGLWFPRSRRAQNAAFILIALAVALCTCVALFMRGPYWEFYWPWAARPPIPAGI